MSTTVAEPDWDTRTDAYLEQQVDDAIDAILDDALCCYRDCEAIATARGVLIPCFDIGEFCAGHRAQIMRVRAVMLRIYGFQNCGRCGQRVDDVHWERIT